MNFADTAAADFFATALIDYTNRCSDRISYTVAENHVVPNGFCLSATGLYAMNAMQPETRQTASHID